MLLEAELARTLSRSASSSLFAISSGDGPAGTGGAAAFGFASTLGFVPACTEVPDAPTFTFPSGVAVMETPGACTETFPFSSTFTEPAGVVMATGPSALLFGLAVELDVDCDGRFDCSGSA